MYTDTQRFAADAEQHRAEIVMIVEQIPSGVSVLDTEGGLPARMTRRAVPSVTSYAILAREWRKSRASTCSWPARRSER